MKLNYLSILLVFPLLFSCQYDDFVSNQNGDVSVSFPKNSLERSIISGEGLEIMLGVNLGRINVNGFDRAIKIELDSVQLFGADKILGNADDTWGPDGLESTADDVDNTAYTLLPSSYYTMDNEIIVPKGKTIGLAPIKFDSLSVANDPDFLDYKYALPFKISDATVDVDSIHAERSRTLIPLKMINTYEGNYYQVGNLKKFFQVDKILDEAFVYGDELNASTTPVRDLKTSGANTVTVDGIANNFGDPFSMTLTVNPTDNSVLISPVATSPIQVEPNGPSAWDPVRRRFILNYKWSDDTRNYQVDDEVLTFRDRVRDGISEWRWDGFSGN